MLTSPSTVYRPDIQGLRALAVVLVVLYHLQPGRLTGGYVGVDVFFVISGFLITSHLVRELLRTGTIRLTHFYARRIRRLLPASFTVLLVCAGFSALWLPKPVWQQTFGEIGASALYGLNWLLASNSTDYLAAAGSATLVQHYWSLGVEEQFYLLWPGLLLAALGMARLVVRRPSDTGRRRTLIVVMAAVFVVSLATSVIVTAKSQPFAYFITATRMWEFAVGGLLALIPATERRDRTSWAGPASWVGLAAIVGAACTLDGRSAFPGWLALLPVAGTAAVIWAGQYAQRWSPAPLVKLRPVQFLGDISYGVYLWHWPSIVAYPLVLGVAPDLGGDLVIVAASVALAWGTKKLIEDPIRTGRYWTANRRRSYSLAAVGSLVTVLACALGLVVIHDLQRQARRPQPSFASQAVLGAEIDRSVAGESPFVDLPGGSGALVPEWITDRCLDVGAANAAQCRYGAAEAARTVAVIGDSVAISYVPAIRAAFEPRGWAVQVLTWSQCPIADVRVHAYGKTEMYAACDEHRAWVFELIAAMKPDLIIGSENVRGAVNALMSNAGAGEWKTGADSSFARLTALSDRVVILGPPPAANCATAVAATGRITCTPGYESWFQAAEQDMAVRHGVVYIDTVPWFCSRTAICPEYIGATLVRADTAHLTASFARRLDKILLESLGDLDAIGAG